MFDDAIANASQNQFVRYSNAAAFAFLGWELCITFPDEINFMRSRSRSWSIKLAYLLLRYYTLIVTLSFQSAGSKLSYMRVSTQFVIALQQFIMASRVYALYGCSRKMAIVLATSFIIQHALIGVFTVLGSQSVTYTSACIPTRVSPASIGTSLPPVLYDFFLLVLSIYRCVQIAPRNWFRTSLIRVLLRDGTWAFAVVFGIFCLNSFLSLDVRGPMTSVASAWRFATCSFAACRIVLHMHREAVNLPSPGASMPSSTFSGGSRRDHFGGPIETSEFALTTFSPGVEFEECEPPDSW